MQIIFDSRFDGVADARRMRAMLDAYITSREADGAPVAGPTTLPGKGHEPMRAFHVVNNVEVDKASAAQIARAAERSVAVVEVFTPGPDGAPSSCAEMPATTVGFTPGDLSGAAPSVADAAPAQSAPEVSTAGVPTTPSAASVPAPPATAPAAPAAPSSPVPTAEGVDSTGLPWDKRIHSSSKVKNADGSWRKLRGLNDAALVSRVEAELRGAASGGYVPAPPPMPAGGTAAQVPPPPPVAAAVPPPPGTSTLTAASLMEWITPKMMNGEITFDSVAAALQANGVESLAALKEHPQVVPAVYAALGGV